MPLPLGVLANVGAVAPVTAADFELISSSILSSNTASVTFSNLGDYSSEYKHLQIRLTARTSSTSVGNSGLRIRVNSDTGNNYAWHRLEGTGSSVVSDGQSSTNGAFLAIAARSSQAANIFSGAVIDLLNPYETKNKTFRSLHGGTGQIRIHINSGFWNNTASITSLTIYDADGANLVTGSRFSLYGIRG